MTAALGPWIMRHPEVKNNMEQFMLQFVTPELESGDVYVRAIVRFSFLCFWSLGFCFYWFLLVTFLVLVWLFCFWFWFCVWFLGRAFVSVALVALAFLLLFSFVFSRTVALFVSLALVAPLPSFSLRFFRFHSHSSSRKGGITNERNLYVIGFGDFRNCDEIRVDVE